MFGYVHLLRCGSWLIVAPACARSCRYGRWALAHLCEKITSPHSEPPAVPFPQIAVDLTAQDSTVQVLAHSAAALLVLSGVILWCAPYCM